MIKFITRHFPKPPVHAVWPMLVKQRQVFHWLSVTILGLLTLPNTLADQPPTPFTAEYKVTRGIMSVGTTKRTLQNKGNGHYLFESVTEPGGIAKLFTSGKVVERSHWRWTDNKFVPLEYEYENSSDQKRNVKLIFDWEAKKVTNIINGDPWTMEIEENTLDKLVYQLAIMYDLNEGEDTLLYQVADGGKTKTYDIKITKHEKLVTELGEFNTTKISRTHKDRTTTMWCAEELQYLPVKIEQRRKDDSPITAELVELSGITSGHKAHARQEHVPAVKETPAVKIEDIDFDTMAETGEPNPNRHDAMSGQPPAAEAAPASPLQK